MWVNEKPHILLCFASEMFLWPFFFLTVQEKTAQSKRKWNYTNLLKSSLHPHVCLPYILHPWASNSVRHWSELQPSPPGWGYYLGCHDNATFGCWKNILIYWGWEAGGRKEGTNHVIAAWGFCCKPLHLWSWLCVWNTTDELHFLFASRWVSKIIFDRARSIGFLNAFSMVLP